MSLVGISLPILQTGSPFAIPRIESLLIKPASAVCNLDCEYCFYLDRDADPYKELPARRMSLDTLERLVETYLAYSYPHSSFIFQGGEPTLAGLPFFEKLVEFQTQYGRSGQVVSNALQTNAVLLDENWCRLFRDYNWFLGVSLDGPEPMHDRYRYNKSGAGSWKQVMQAVALLQHHQVPFNILCVVSQANVEHAAELYRFFKSLGVDNLQFIPLAEFDAQGNPQPFTLTAQQYGQFLVDLHEAWQPDRHASSNRPIHIRFFDNILEALAGKKPTTCTMHQSCDSYAVVEYNGDVYPCDFFVEKPWKLGNIMADSWGQIAARPRRLDFASKKAVPHADCQVCEYQSLCHSGCPKLRTARHQNFEDLDYFCQSYKMIFPKFKT